MRRRRDKTASHGFILPAVLLLVGLLASLILLLHLQVASAWRTGRRVEAQMHSRILAENGIEYARDLLPRLGPRLPFLGDDGRPCSQGPPGHDPLAPVEAARMDLAAPPPLCDDGLLNLQQAEGRRRRILRVRMTRAPLQPEDEEGEILVRSLGAVEFPSPDPFFPGRRNAVTLLEARFRRERSLVLPSPLTILAQRGRFEWEGRDFLIDGTDRHPISVISQSVETPSAPSLLLRDLRASLLGVDPRVWAGAVGSVMQDRTREWRDQRLRAGLFSPGYWRHLEDALPSFARGLRGGLAYLDNPGSRRIEFRGFLAVRGHLSLRGSSRIEGLLIHLGGGRLELRGQTRIEGGVLAVAASMEGAPNWGVVDLLIGDQARLLMSPDRIEEALAELPPVQLGWRIILPEMSP